MEAVTLDLIIRFAELLAIICGGGAVIWRLSATVARFEGIGRQQAKEIKELKDGLDKMTAVLTTIAVQDTRINHLSATITRLENSVEELRRGVGFIKNG